MDYKPFLLICFFFVVCYARYPLRNGRSTDGVYDTLPATHTFENKTEEESKNTEVEDEDDQLYALPDGDVEFIIDFPSEDEVLEEVFDEYEDDGFTKTLLPVEEGESEPPVEDTDEGESIKDGKEEPEEYERKHEDEKEYWEEESSFVTTTTTTTIPLDTKDGDNEEARLDGEESESVVSEEDSGKDKIELPAPGAVYNGETEPVKVDTKKLVKNEENEEGEEVEEEEEVKKVDHEANLEPPPETTDYNVRRVENHFDDETDDHVDTDDENEEDDRDVEDREHAESEERYDNEPEERGVEIEKYESAEEEVAPPDMPAVQIPEQVES